MAMIEHQPVTNSSFLSIPLLYRSVSQIQIQKWLLGLRGLLTLKNNY
jgi:hypothetical protein